MSAPVPRISHSQVHGPTSPTLAPESGTPANAGTIAGCCPSWASFPLADEQIKATVLGIADELTLEGLVLPHRIGETGKVSLFCVLK